MVREIHNNRNGKELTVSVGDGVTGLAVGIWVGLIDTDGTLDGCKLGLVDKLGLIEGIWVGLIDADGTSVGFFVGCVCI